MSQSDLASHKDAENAEIASNKQVLRKKLRAERRKFWSSQTKLERQRIARRLSENFMQIKPACSATAVALYYAMGGEAPTRMLASALHARSPNIQLLYPYMQIDAGKREMYFVQKLAGQEWQRDDARIFAPPKSAASCRPEVIVLPLLAFTVKGDRLGQGAGDYDRALGKMYKDNISKPFFIGLAFECQKRSIIPTQRHDVKLDAIVTESEVYSIATS